VRLADAATHMPRLIALWRERGDEVLHEEMARDPDGF
jgi:hypothetical protein